MADDTPVEKPDDTVARGSAAFPGAEDIMGFWTAWTQNVSRLASDQGSPAAPPVMDIGRITPDRLSGDLLQRDACNASQNCWHGIRSCSRLSTRSTPKPASPASSPWIWAEIARALRNGLAAPTGRPETAFASRRPTLLAVNWQSTFEAWRDAGQRW